MTSLDHMQCLKVDSYNMGCHQHHSHDPGILLGAHFIQDPIPKETSLVHMCVLVIVIFHHCAACWPLCDCIHLCMCSHNANMHFCGFCESFVCVMKQGHAHKKANNTDFFLLCSYLLHSRLNVKQQLPSSHTEAVHSAFGARLFLWAKKGDSRIRAVFMLSSQKKKRCAQA